MLLNIRRIGTLLIPLDHSRSEYIVPFVPSAMTKETFKHYLTHVHLPSSTSGVHYSPVTATDCKDFVTNIELADLLNISLSVRMAIWKHINELDSHSHRIAFMLPYRFFRVSFRFYSDLKYKCLLYFNCSAIANSQV